MGMNYVPEKTAVGPFTTELCEYLAAEEGHRVSVVTSFPHYPEWSVYPPYRHRLFLREQINGIPIHRAWVYVPRKTSALRRIAYDSSWSFSSIAWGLFIRDVDVILAVSPPLQLGLTAYVLGKVRSAPFVFLIEDLVPDAAVALGIMSNQRILRIARVLEGFVYRKAETLIVICKGFAENLQRKGVPPSRMLVLPHWVDTDFIGSMERSNAFRQMHGITNDQFLVLHAGNMGAKQGLENVVAAAAHLEQREGIVFLLVGEGSEKENLVQQAKALHLQNVRFLPLQPKDLLPAMLSDADLLLLNQRADVVDMSIPSKLLTYMAAGRTVLAGVHLQSEAARYVNEAECGVVVAPERPDKLADAIRRIRASPGLRAHFGHNARAYAEMHFDKKQVLRRYAEFFRRFAA